MNTRSALACAHRRSLVLGSKSPSARRRTEARPSVFAWPGLWFESLEPRWLLSAPANLDPSFGQNGAAALPDGLSAGAIAAAPAGGIYVAGASPDSTGIDLCRFNADGTLDSTFGTAGVGYCAADMSPTPDTIIVQPDGRILVTCMWNATNLDLTTTGTLARFNADGSADTSFGVNGSVVVTGHDNFTVWGASIGNSVDTMAAATSVSSLGKITVVSKDGTSIQLQRFNADGSPDVGFGRNGLRFIPMQSTPNIPGEDIVAGVTADGGFVVDEIYYPLDPASFRFVPIQEFRIDSAGRLVSQSNVTMPFGVGHAEAARVAPNGQLVFYKIGDSAASDGLNTPGGPTYILGGIQPIWDGFPAQDPTLSVAPDGKIYALAMLADGSGAVQRFNTDGTPDRTFSHGQVMTGVGDSPLNMSLPLADGSVIVEGNQQNGSAVLFKVLPGGPAGPADPVPVDPVDPADATSADGTDLSIRPAQAAGMSSGDSYNGLFGTSPISVLGLSANKHLFDDAASP
jgi:uncharacterized delta-60 repeat protein